MVANVFPCLKLFGIRICLIFQVGFRPQWVWRMLELSASLMLITGCEWLYWGKLSPQVLLAGSITDNSGPSHSDALSHSLLKHLKVTFKPLYPYSFLRHVFFIDQTSLFTCYQHTLTCTVTHHAYTNRRLHFLAAAHHRQVQEKHKEHLCLLYFLAGLQASRPI